MFQVGLAQSLGLIGFQLALRHEVSALASGEFNPGSVVAGVRDVDLVDPANDFVSLLAVHPVVGKETTGARRGAVARKPDSSVPYTTVGRLGSDGTVKFLATDAEASLNLGLDRAVNLAVSRDHVANTYQTASKL